MGSETELQAQTIDKYTVMDKEDDKRLLSDEIEELESIQIQEQNFLEKKYQIIQKSADKLQNEHDYPDKTIVSSRLKKIFKDSKNPTKNISQSTIEKALNNKDYKKYKRSYTINDLTLNPDDYDEMFAILEDSIVKQGEMIKEIINKRSDPKVKEDMDREFDSILHELHENFNYYITKWSDQFRNLTDLPKIIDFLKNEQTELQIIKNYLDERKKLHPFMKIRMKQLLLINSFSSLAKRFDISSKWTANKEKDGFLQRLIERARCCPHCHADLIHWFSQVEMAELNGIQQYITPNRFFYNINNPTSEFSILTVTKENIPTEKLNHCHYERCKSFDKPFKLGDQFSHLYFEDKDENKHDSYYHVPCIKQKKKLQLNSIIPP